MPGDDRPVTAAAVRAHIADHCFRGPPGAAVGVELERLSVRLSDPGAPLDFDELVRAAAGTGCAPDDREQMLPRGTTITLEPGGQIELSTAAPGATATAACDRVSDDLLVLDAALREHDFGLVALGYDPVRPPARIHPKARYRAMAEYFGDGQPAARSMMCSTASVQVNVELGDDDTVRTRWRHAHAVGPVLAAMFANSPAVAGTYAGLVGARTAVWSDFDRRRTASADHAHDPVDDWTDYALAANVVFVTDTITGELRVPTRAMTFGQWVRDRHPRPPMLADLAVHLTTLFPPVRPRGWLELRMIDTLPSPWWRAAVAVATALVTDTEAGAEAAAAAAGLTPGDAAHGLAHPAYARAARVALSAAVETLGDHDPDARDVVVEYGERWTSAGRTPGDDRLDAWRRGAPLLDPDADLLGAG